MVQRAQFAVGIAMSWLAAVAGVSAAAWLAIDRVGRDVSNVGVVSQRPRPVGTPAPTTTSASGPSGTDVRQTPSATVKPSTVKPSATGKPPVTTRPSTPRPRVPSQSRANQTPPRPPQDRTFTIPGGQVSVRCTGTTMVLRIAQPDNGWRVEVDQDGPEEVAVRFQRMDDNAGRGTRITTVCATGSPVLLVDSKG